MAIYNTCVSVIANLEAASEADAIAKLYAALRSAGFEVYDEGNDAFEAEEGTERTPLPGQL